MNVRPKYTTGFAPRDGLPRYPSLWTQCVASWAPCLGPTGLLLRDESGFRRHGTLTNMLADTAWKNIDGSMSLYFEAADDYVPFSTTVSLETVCSIAFWWRTETAGTVARWRSIITTNATAGDGIFIKNGTTELYIENSTSATYTGTNIADALWHHIVVCRDAANALCVWIDGNLNSHASTRSSQITVQSLSSATDYAGAGYVDDVRLYNRMLSPWEIRLLGRRRGIAYELAPRTALKTSSGNRRRRSLLRVN